MTCCQISRVSMVIACVVFTPEDVRRYLQIQKWIEAVGPFVGAKQTGGGRNKTVVSNHVWVTVPGTHSLTITVTE